MNSSENITLRKFLALTPMLIGLVSALMAGTSSVTFAAGKHMTGGVPGIKTIALFPVANSATGAGADADIAANELTDAIKLRINALGAYQATSFNVHLSSVQRALTIDNTLTQDDVKMPVTDPTTAQKIARLMGTDGFFLGEIDSYKEDATTHAVSLTFSGNLYFTDSGASARTIAITGNAVPAGESEGAEAVLNRAVQNAAGQAVAAMGTTGYGNSGHVPNTKSVNSGAVGTTLVVAILAAMTAVIVNNTRHNGGSNPSNSSTTVGSTGSSSSGSSSPPTAPF